MKKTVLTQNHHKISLKKIHITTHSTGFLSHVDVQAHNIVLTLQTLNQSTWFHLHVKFKSPYYADILICVTYSQTCTLNVPYVPCHWIPKQVDDGPLSPCGFTRYLTGESFKFLTLFYSSNWLCSWEFLILFITLQSDLFLIASQPTTDVGKFLWGCLLKSDMRSGDMARSCRGRLSIGVLEGHTPCVLDWVPRATFRPTALFKIITLVIVVTLFRSAPLGVHVCFRRHTFFDPSSCSTFAAASNHLSYHVLKTPPSSMQSMVASMYCAFATPIPRFSLRLLPETSRSLNSSLVPRRMTMCWFVAPPPYAHLTCPPPSLWPKSCHVRICLHQ